MQIENRSVKYNPVHKKMHEIWRSMMGRCYRPTSHSYKNYGAKGVTVCEKWHTYDGFLDDIDKVEGFDIDLLIKGELQLDKDIKQEDVESKIYSLETCVFVSRSENSSNRYNNKKFIGINLINQEVILSKNREDICRKFNLDSSSVWRILKNNSSNKKLYKNVQTYKNWHFQYLDTFDINLIPSKTFRYIMNKNTTEIFKIDSQRKFYTENNITPYRFKQILKKKDDEDWEFIKKEEIQYKDSTTIERQLIALGVINETK